MKYRLFVLILVIFLLATFLLWKPFKEKVKRWLRSQGVILDILFILLLLLLLAYALFSYLYYLRHGYIPLLLP